MAVLNAPVHKTALRGLAWLGIVVLLGFFAWLRLDGVSMEAMVRESVGQRLLDHCTDGRQALVGSVWWAPLPTLLRMPFTYLLGTTFPGLPSMFVSVFFGAALLWLLNHVLRQWQAGGIRFLLIAMLACQPLFVRQCFDGSSTTTNAFLTLLLTYNLALWIIARKLRALVVLGVGGSCLFLSSMPMALWLLFALGVLALMPPVPGATLPEKKAVGLLILWPILYAIGLWALTNWLILGDGFYFVRLLSPGGAAATDDMRALRHAACYWPAACMLLLLTVAIIRRDPRGVAIGLISLGPAVVAAALTLTGYLGDPMPVLFTLLPLAILALGYLYRISSPSAARRRGWVLAALTVCALTLAQYRPGAGAFQRIVVPAADAGARRDYLLSQIRHAIMQNSTKAKVFVCGYDSYSLLGSAADPLFLPALDFNFYQAVADYPGYRLYLLVHHPVDGSAYDSIHWKYPHLFSRGHRNLLYYKDWGDWRLFELVQAPRKERT